MGSDFSKQVCCMICGRCKKWKAEEASGETSETKPILRTSEETSMWIDSQPSTPALEVSKQGSEEVLSLSQHQQPSAGAEEENMETCSAAAPTRMTEGWVALLESMDFSATPADGENKEVEVLTHLDNQQETEEVGNTEEKIKPVAHASEAQPVPHTAEEVKLVEYKEQPDEQGEAGSEGTPCAGITLQEDTLLNFREITSETAAGQDCEIKPPAEIITGRNLPLCAAQGAEETETDLPPQHEEETDGAQPAEISPQSTERDELMYLFETLLTMQVNPLEVVANCRAGVYSPSIVPRAVLYPEEGSPEPGKHLVDFLQQETQSNGRAAREMESLHCAAPLDLSNTSRQSSDGERVLGEDEGTRECDAETAASEEEPQCSILQQTAELPEEPRAQQDTEFLNVAPSLPEVLESSQDTEAENVEA